MEISFLSLLALRDAMAISEVLKMELNIDEFIFLGGALENL